MSADIEVVVRKFIQQNFYVDDAARLPSEASLVQEGIVDSTGMLEVIGFLEGEFGIRIEDREAVPANLETIGRIGRFVAAKRAPRPTG